MKFISYFRQSLAVCCDYTSLQQYSRGVRTRGDNIKGWQRQLKWLSVFILTVWLIQKKSRELDLYSGRTRRDVNVVGLA